MRFENKEGICPICGGDRQPGTTLFSVDLGHGVVVVRNVPASVCSQCGEALLSDETAAELERIVGDARAHKRQVEVMEMGG
ncbi:MAG: type II toxin-antitoxin system MqsA family antitoxin [Calditrichota bacterium]